MPRDTNKRHRHLTPGQVQLTSNRSFVCLILGPQVERRVAYAFPLGAGSQYHSKTLKAMVVFCGREPVPRSTMPYHQTFARITPSGFVFFINSLSACEMDPIVLHTSSSNRLWISRRLR